jgi:xanthine dehydrogenase accessory factor
MADDDPAALLRELVAAVDSGERVVLATVVDTCRSVPRHAGTKMLVHEDGRRSGSIGGGAIESRVATAALATLADGRARLVRYDLLDPRNAEPGTCGGEMTVFLEPHLPAPTVLVIGCGTIGRAVVDLAHWLGFRVAASDDRQDMVTGDLLPGADLLLPGPAHDALAAVPASADTHLVLSTRGVQLDAAVLPPLLTRQDGSISVLGSSRRWAATRAELLARGVSEDALSRVRAPAGLSLGAETPREIALAIMAEIVAVRRAGQVVAAQSAVRPGGPVRAAQPTVRSSQPAVRSSQPAVRSSQPAVRSSQPAVRSGHSVRLDRSAMRRPGPVLEDQS